MINIRRALPGDWPALWNLLEPVFRAGETYAIDRDISASAAHQLWCTAPLQTYIAENPEQELLGTYLLKPNQGGGGRHVANAAYVVAESARGRGVASTLCAHSQERAHALGFLAMQFNCVVATNLTAVRLWKRMGFSVVGTLPNAFDHPVHGLVDAYVMYKSLETVHE
ncbi:GNAT family N-acetyltransferase [uncultured Abyssibacter sp.]|uniref:GNAT family N-acetyltransferase n=1 Tax=uncultured Abyssibacter sp. TaxID=2320202 RepID=UPI0032B254A4